MADPSSTAAMAPEGAEARLSVARNLWVATVRGGRRPHLVPVWFVCHTNRFYFCIQPESVKARNLRQNPRLAVALEDGTHPLICEAEAELRGWPPPLPIAQAFLHKYEWDLGTEDVYTLLVEATARKWLAW